MENLINLLRTNKGDWSTIHEELQKIVGRKESLEILLADLIEELKKDICQTCTRCGSSSPCECFFYDNAKCE